MTPLTLYTPEIPGVLSGRVTRIFRVLKPQPSEALIHAGAVKWCGEKDRETFLSDIQYFECNWKMPGFVRRIWPNSISPGEYWVRETWVQIEGPEGVEHEGRALYRADACDNSGRRWYSVVPGDPDKEVKWRSPVTMPRHLSRASIRITDVRVHRVQDATEAEAVDAGSFPTPPHPIEHPHKGKSATENFAAIFNAINGPGSWEKNPWVVGAEIERIET